jgi:hypothetical protein
LLTPYIKQDINMTTLDASVFTKKSLYLDREFEFILSGVYKCYQRMLVDYSTIENNENKIRNRLYKDYLKSSSVRTELGLENYIFHPEVPEIDENYDESARTDVIVYNAVNYAKDETAYYIVECKRIDGSKGLNDKYWLNGINRFIEDRYPTNKSVNAMLGFIVKPINIEANCLKIPGLTTYAFIPQFMFSYTSTHTSINLKEFTLYHLMLNFSSLISPAGSATEQHFN